MNLLNPGFLGRIVLRCLGLEKGHELPEVPAVEVALSHPFIRALVQLKEILNLRKQQIHRWDGVGPMLRPSAQSRNQNFLVKPDVVNRPLYPILLAIFARLDLGMRHEEVLFGPHTLPQKRGIIPFLGQTSPP